jgi:hypothetical protein
VRESMAEDRELENIEWRFLKSAAAVLLVLMALGLMLFLALWVVG